MSHIVIAPFSNSDIRDWPAGHYGALIGLLLAAWDGAIHIVGAPNQSIRAREIVRLFDPTRVINHVGRAPWQDTMHLIRSASCVIGNNSGVAHVAAFEDVPTICLFSGAHQRWEWRPIGERVVTVSRAIACAPCYLHHAAHCPNGLACLDQIAPQTVLETILNCIGKAPMERFADVA